MKKISLILAFVVIAVFEACMTDSGSGDTKTIIDTLKVTVPAETVLVKGTKPRTPKAIYATDDSLVTVSIYGFRRDEGDKYWVYRNDSLLEQPVSKPSDSITNLYQMVDTVGPAGKYVYYVRYGDVHDSLSDKSPKFTYAYPGRSASGRLAIAADTDGSIRLALTAPLGKTASQASFERKIGSKGTVEELDRVEASLRPGHFEYADTAFVADDTWLFYRASIRESATGPWLEPTPWDSIAVRNKFWNYVPQADIALSGKEVSAFLLNPIIDSGKSFIYLYRSASTAEAGGTKVDSVPSATAYVLVPNQFRDIPKDTGTYYYWLTAKDSHGRISPRSKVQKLHFTGNPAGLKILSILTTTESVRLGVASDENNHDIILERAQDTTGTAVILDTLGFSNGFGQAYFDHPPANGYWYYRQITLFPDSTLSDPGPWSASGYYKFSPSLMALHSGITNRGDHVEADAILAPDKISVLYRSALSTGADSVAVDTVQASASQFITVSNLKDIPAPGTWYYRVRELPVPGKSSAVLGQSDLVRIVFTGNPVGPDIMSLILSGTGITATFSSTGDNPGYHAIAFILERAADKSNTWTAVDTGVVQSFTGRLQDTPPSDGYWKYRIRAIKEDLSLSDPGAEMRTGSAYTYDPQYASITGISLTSDGTRISCTEYPRPNTVSYLIRSQSPDWRNGIAVDSLSPTIYATALADVPGIGVWYYWLQRESHGSDGIISRSEPVRFNFNGVPEITSLSVGTGSVVIDLPDISYPSFYTVYRSYGNPENLATFSPIYIETSYAYNNGSYRLTYLDREASKRSARMYYYRVTVTDQYGVESEMSGYKSIYYEAAQ